MSLAPKIPNSSPFSPDQRLWLDGYIAALTGAPASEEAGNSAPKRKVLVMYASQSGNSEALAEEFGERLVEAGFNAPVVCTEDFPVADLVNEKNLILVSSTWGEGDPPDNAVDFWSDLSSDDAPRLEDMKFSILGLGDSNYVDFCVMGKQFDSRLEALGATRFAPRGDCDTDFEEPAEAWFQKVLSELGSDSQATAKSSDDSSAVAYSKKNPFPATLTSNRKLNTAESDRDTRHFEISLAGSGMSYEVGDVLAVFPKNDPALVDELLEKLSFSGDSNLRESLIDTYDICSISAKLIEDWTIYCDDPKLKSDSIKDYVANHQLIDLVTDFPPAFPSASEFTGVLRKLGARLYSISSSPNAHPDEVHLTVAKVTYDLHGKGRKGVCSTYLSDRVSETDDVKVYLQHVKHFKLPEDTSVPVVMVGPGTGVAPFRAFLEERAVSAGSGENWLFFGNPHESTDWFYREQFQQMEADGVLTNYSKAWSRDQAEKVYVQDHIRESGEELWSWISKGAHFYVCGDAKRMAKDVDDALHEIISTYGKLSAEAAADYVVKMKKDKRYQRDVY